MTFDEHIARGLRNRGIDPDADPAVIREQLNDLDRQARIRAQEELALVRDHLLAHGIGVQELSELATDADRLQAAVPLLVEMFPRLATRAIRQAILEVLETGRGFPREMLQLFRSVLPAIEEERRRGKSYALAQFASYIGSCIDQTRSVALVFDEIVAVFGERRYGWARGVFAETLLKVKARRGEAVAALLGQLDDVEIAVWVVAALAKAGAVEAVPRIRAHADSPTTLLRNEARKAIRKLERVSGSAPSAPAPQSTRRESESTATIAKTSRNCDLERLHGILLRLPAVLEGVQAGEVQRVLSTIEAMEPDDEQVFTLTASWQGVPERVTLDVFMDDVDAPDVTFGARPEIIRLIDELFSA